MRDEDEFKGGHLVYHDDPTKYYAQVHSINEGAFSDTVDDKDEGPMTRVGEKYEPWNHVEPEYRGGHMVWKLHPDM